MDTIPQTRGSTIKPGQAGAEACAAWSAPTHACSGHGRPLAAGAAGALSRLSRPASVCRHHQGSIRQRAEHCRRAPHIVARRAILASLALKPSGVGPKLAMQSATTMATMQAPAAARSAGSRPARARGCSLHTQRRGLAPVAMPAAQPTFRGASIARCKLPAGAAAAACRRRLRPATLGARARLRLAAFCCFLGTACMLSLNSPWCRLHPHDACSRAPRRARQPGPPRLGGGRHPKGVQLWRLAAAMREAVGMHVGGAPAP